MLKSIIADTEKGLHKLVKTQQKILFFASVSWKQNYWIFIKQPLLGVYQNQQKPPDFSVKNAELF